MPLTKMNTTQQEKNKKRNAAAVAPKIVNKTMRNKAPTVVSPPSAPDLTSLLTGHVGRDGEQQGTDGIAAMDTAMTDIGANGAATMDMDITPLVKDPVNDNVKSQKKEIKKAKSTNEEKLSERSRNCTSLKMSSFATPAVAATSSAKDYNFEQVFYKAGLELKGNDKYSAHVKHTGNLLENIQLVDLLVIMHAVDKLGGASLLAPSRK